MKPLQFAALVGAVFAGCFAGAWSALRPMPVQAQQNVRIEDYVMIPNNGLQMKNSRGQIVGLISEQNGAGMFTLFSSTGQPSVQIAGGSGGMVSLGANEGTSGLIVTGAGGEEVRVLTQAGKGLISAGGAKARVQIVGGTENSITVPGADGATQIDLRSAVDGGIFRLNGGGKTLIELTGSAGKGHVSVNGEGPAGVRLDGSGLLDILQGGRSVFAAPVKTQSGRPSPLAL
jgi:hypothetical protein